MASSGASQAEQITIGRVYDDVDAQLGRRVLVDRLWPRGTSKAKAALDEWCKDVAPSTELRKWYAHDPARAAEFRKRYRRELTDGEQAAALQHLRELSAEGPLLLLTATKDPESSEAAVLADLLREDQG